MNGVDRPRSIHRWRGWRGRRIRLTLAGALFSAGALAVGLAAINTGNNLLYLLLGGMLGAIATSGWLSERALRGLEATRRVPRGVSAGREGVIGYTLENRRRAPALGIQLREAGVAGPSFVARIGPGEVVQLRAVHTFPQRGVYPLDRITVATSFPFGFIRRERDLPLAAEVVVWPRTDRPVAPVPSGAGYRRQGASERSRAVGPRGEFQGLREYRPGDDARDIHWRRSAGRATPVMREYDRDVSETLWICLDLASAPGALAEEAVEIAAALAARATAVGRRHGLVAGARVLQPGVGRGHLAQTLDALARARFDPDTPWPELPAPASACVLVGTRARPGGWADLRLAGQP